ncbi:MAG: DAK2 domain-containing protein [Bacilli bacterium]|nr:DAK2 domain-containing protein [Bacilli bacterium]
MELLTLNGQLFKEITKCAALNLRANYEEVDNLNVFPVPDGDTGTNMCRTIEGGVSAIASSEENNIGLLGKALSKGALMGARGNSGVILSQIYRGICKGLANYEEVNVLQLAEAYKVGVTQAYQAVVTPVEGTILTVYREATEYACANITENSTINDFFKLHLKQALVSLANTPNLLPVLKEAGVVDSGGQGYVYMVKGIVRYLDGEEVEGSLELEAKKETGEAAPVDFNAFTADDVLQFGYCTEFILRLQNSKVDVASFDENVIIDYLQNSDVKGDSIVCLKDEDVIKTHVHTKNPGLVLTKMREFGEFLTIKIENMALQHNEITEEEKAPYKKYAIVAVASGEGLSNQFKEFGVDQIVSGNNTMNPSTEDFIAAYKKINADHIFVFPNNKNIIMAAKQSAELYKGAEIHVIETKTIPQCYSALTMLDFSVDDVDAITEGFNESIANVTSGEVTYSIRDCELGGVQIHKGEYMAILNGKIVASVPNKIDVLPALLSKVENIDDKQVIVIIFGEDVTDEEKELAVEAVQKACPFVEVGTIDGGQSVYSYWIDIE